MGHCCCLSENPMQKYLPNIPLKSHGLGNGSVLPEARCGDWQAAGNVQRHICMSGSYSFLHTSLIKSGLPKGGIFTLVSLSRYLPPPVCVLQSEGVKCSLIVFLHGELEHVGAGAAVQDGISNPTRAGSVWLLAWVPCNLTLFIPGTLVC